MKKPTVGAGLRACRERAGMTQQELADVLMRDVTYISKVENNKVVPDAETYNEWIAVTNGPLLMFVYTFGDDATKVIQTV